MDRALLTICIYSYNRGPRVRAQLSHLLPLVEEFDGNIELVVSNNKSSDRTEELIKTFKSPHLRVINRELHLPTAEEHIYETVPLINSKFVWFLGDDDVPILSTIRSAVELLKSDRFDFLLFNSCFVDGKSAVARSRFVRMRTELAELEFTNGALALGFISVIAGVSNSIFRTDIAMRTDWRSIFSVGQVYSQVAWWLTGFKGTRLAIINKPLLFYRVESHTKLSQHFVNTAEKLDVPNFHFWGHGLIRLIDHLETHGVVTREQIKNVFEYDQTGGIHRLLDTIIGAMAAQIKSSVDVPVERNAFPAADFEYCSDWLLAHDPTYFECIEVLRLGRDAQDLPALADRKERVEWADADFRAILQAKISTQNRLIGLEETFLDYDIYRHRNGWVAFQLGSEVDRVEVMTAFDPGPISPVVLTAGTIADLKAQILEVLEHGRKRIRN